MIKASLIYIIVTILLAFIDAWRIKKAKGIVENIDHDLSVMLAIIGAAIICITIAATSQEIIYTIEWLLILLGFINIRLAFFDAALNLWRRYKIDYQSPTTSSYVDQHTNKLTFWEKRAIGLAGWGICAIVYYIIFKK